MADSSKVFRFGKNYVAIVYPDIYFQFVSLLHREHPELLDAMVIAQVTMQDGTALDFLNHILGTNVTKETPMELGYAEMYDKLKQRPRSIIVTGRTNEFAAKQIADTYLGFKREESERGKPLFPSIEEMEDKGMKPH